MALSRGSKGFLAVLLTVGLVLVGGLTFLRPSPAPASTGTVPVEVPEGSSAGQVADILEQQGIISSALAFQIGSRLDGRAGRIQAGSYQLTPGIGTRAILDELTKPREAAPSYRVVIPEGLTVAQTLQRIAETEGSPHTVEALAAALPSLTLPAWVPPAEQIPPGEPYPGLTRYEGLLFPDTYEFFATEDAVSVLNTLVARTGEIVAQAPSTQLTPYQVLTVASLIEREARLPEEQAVISSVVRNRLAVPMRLEMDASSLYAAGRAGETTVTRDVLEAESPWNTYRTDALPPTPIAGAGQGAIAAAAAPADTPYLYYVVSDPATGQHAFAQSYEEHLDNVSRYRALEG